MSGQHYCLRWNNYQSNMTSVFHHLLRSQAFVDVTLACNEQSLKAHKVVLSACSSYFQKLLMENPCKHPTIIMPQDICFSDLKFIIEFVYRGEIDVSQAELQSLLKTADQLKIKGLCEVEESQEGEGSPGGSPRHRRPRTALKRRLHDSIVHHLNHSQAGGSMDVGTSTDGDNKEGGERDSSEEEMNEPNELPLSPHHNHIIPDHHQMMIDGELNGMDRTREDIRPLTPRADIQKSDAASQSHDMSEVKVKYESLRSLEQSESLQMDTSLSERPDQTEMKEDHSMQTMMITPELLGLLPTSHSEGGRSETGSTGGNDSSGGLEGPPKQGKTWTAEDMEAALDALRNQTMSLTKASLHYGIPSTTLWQRAHRLGIDTPKKDGPAKSWTEDNLNVALEALRSGTISANKASKAYGIPSSTLYKIARREGIRLAAPFNAAPTTWNPDDLERALEAIRSGQTTVQRAAADYGIPSGTLYGRCKREGIGLTRNNPTPWSEQAMNDALEAVRVGQMSINQAAIHYNLPYSSLYGRFKRGKYESTGTGPGPGPEPEDQPQLPSQPSQQLMLVQYQQPSHMYSQPAT